MTGITTSVTFDRDLYEWIIGVHGYHRRYGAIGQQFCGYLDYPPADEIAAVVARFVANNR